MRTISANASASLSQNTGTEIMVVLEVEWVDGGHIYYSDQDITGAQTKVISMGGFDSSMQLQGAGDSQQIQVALDDTDGSIRAIYNSNDIHKRPASVYLLHKGNNLELDKILVFKGELVTPIEWDETQRTVSFSILSKLNSRQVGFSMEEGDFPDIPDEALGKAWPLVFGQVCHLPAVKVRAPRRGYLMEGVGIKDFTLEPRLCQAKKIECPSQSQGEHPFYSQQANNNWNVTKQTVYGVDPECSRRAFGEICKLDDLREQQEALETSPVEIWNGESFPQGEKITIKVDGAELTGIFTGNSFDISNRKHPDYDGFDHVKCRDVPSFGYKQPSAENIEFVCGNKSCFFRDTTTGSPYTVNVSDKMAYWKAQREAGPWALYGVSQPEIDYTCEQLLVDDDNYSGMVGGAKDSWAYYDEMEEAGFHWTPAGSEVFLESESDVLYIVSLITGTVDKVSAYRTAPNGIRYLTEVPTDYYTVQYTDYGGYEVVEIKLDKELKEQDKSWENQIYVSFTSTVGPNACDIIEWLVDKYTDLSIDATSFASVKTYLTNYPNNFYLTNRPDVYSLIQDIAYQSRCAVYIRNDVVYIRYLSVEPTSERTIDESDILTGTFVEYLTETEDVYTTHEINWKKAGAPVQSNQEVERKLILKYNVSKYGTVKNNWDYYTYNIYDLVLKSGTFWLIRKANSWKKVRFQLPIKHIDLDVGDCITLSVSQFSADDVKVVIEAINVSPDAYTMDVECWTPIRSGESSPYYWAWPSQQSQYQIWPLSGDNNGGGGYTFEVTPPIGHILSGGSGTNDNLIISSGDKHPSDIDDTLPSVTCEVSDYWDFDEEEPAIVAKKIAQSAARQSMQNTAADNSGAQGSNNSKKPESEDDCGSGAGCNYKVNVTWHTSQLQGEGGGGPCACRPGGGSPSCAGPSWVVCHSFGAAFAAQSFASYMRGSHGKSISDNWLCGETAVLYANPSNGKHTESGCPDISDASPDGTGGRPSGQTKEPTGTTGNELATS